MKAWMTSNFGTIPLRTPELSALERLKKWCIMMYNTLALLLLIGSSSFLQVTRTSITSRTSSKLG